MKNSDLKRLYGKDNMPNKDGFPRLNEKGELDVPVSSAAIVPPADVPEGKVMASNGQGGTKWVDDVSGTPVEANPETTGSETKLTSIKIDDTKYLLGTGDVASVNGKTGEVTLTKSDIGLNNVNNTADANKPISNATQEALNEKQASLVSGTNIKTLNGSSILGSGDLAVDAVGFQYMTTAPTVANTDGNLKLVVLDQEPATKYDGYIYLIKEPGE